MSFLNAEQLTDLLTNESTLRVQLRKLAVNASQSRVGALVLSKSEQGSTIFGPEYLPIRAGLTPEFLGRLSTLATETSDNTTDAALIISSRPRGITTDELIHPVQLQHYGDYASAHPGAIGGSVSAIHGGRLSIQLFARPAYTLFNAAPLRAVHELAPRNVVEGAIASSGIVTASFTFISGSMMPEPHLENIERLF